MWWTCAFTPTQMVSLSHMPLSGYLPFYSLSFTLNMITQLLCNKHWYVQSWTSYPWYVDLHQTVIIILFDLFIFLSWPMWWTCAFTPTQRVSWLLEWYMYTLSYISSRIGKHARFSKGVCHMPPMYIDLPSPSYSLSPIYSELGNTKLVCNKQWYVQSWTFYWCCDDVDLHQTVMRLHDRVVWLVFLS